jgi:hypothetical protein
MVQVVLLAARMSWLVQGVDVETAKLEEAVSQARLAFDHHHLS